MVIGSATVSSGYSDTAKSASPGSETRNVDSTEAPRKGQKRRSELSGSSTELTEEQQRQVTELQRRDREVRAHEAAHIAAGGGFVRGGAQFSYQSGPDGKRYAVGGEVSIDTSAVKDNPSATIAKMQAVRSAALAPSNPSGQDRSVAASASAQEAQARQEMQQQQDISSGGGGNGREKVTSQRGYDGNGRTQDSPPEPQFDLRA